MKYYRKRDLLRFYKFVKKYKYIEPANLVEIYNKRYFKISIRKRILKKFKSIYKKFKKTYSEKDIICIKSVILDYFNQSKEEIFNKYKGSQKREKCYTRQLTVYFFKQFTRLSLSEIGREIGGYDHSTVLHSKKTINNLYDVDRVVRNDIENIGAMIKEKLL